MAGILKLAIIGGGPSAFYVASRLLSLLPLTSPHSPRLNVHIFDRLWAPHGLVRYGVAPDHPEVKNCTNKFDTAAKDPRFRFFGNVNIGPSSSSPSPIPHTLHLPISSISQNYTHLLFATGCTRPTLHPQLPPSPHCTPGLSLVHWYTQHPTNPPPLPLDTISHLSVIGNGNVALDIARILLTPPSLLSKHDVPAPVLNLLSRSAIKHISIIARRGPLEAAFAAKELREMMNLSDAYMLPIAPALLSPPPSTPLTRQQSRLLHLLQTGSTHSLSHPQKTWSLDFFRSPTSLIPSSPSSNLQLTLAHTTLDPTTKRALPIGETSTLLTSHVITSLGFHGESTSPFYDPALKHLRTTDSGHILSSSGIPVKNVYASGWAATGAKGVLAATMVNAHTVVDTLLSDWMHENEAEVVSTPNGAVSTTPVSPQPEKDAAIADDADADHELPLEPLNPSPHPSDPPPEIQTGLREGLVTEYGDWKMVDAEEVRRGSAAGKERERMGWEEARAFVARARSGTRC